MIVKNDHFDRSLKDSLWHVPAFYKSPHSELRN